jgi:hypothetical protein
MTGSVPFMRLCIFALSFVCLSGCGGLAEAGNGTPSDAGNDAGQGAAISCLYQPKAGFEGGEPMGPICAYVIDTVGPIPVPDNLSNNCMKTAMVGYVPGKLSSVGCSSSGLVGCCESTNDTIGDGGRLLGGECYYLPWMASKARDLCGSGWSTTLPR